MSLLHHHPAHEHHCHEHDYAHPPEPTTQLGLVFLVTAGYMVVEALGGWFSGSLALFADAGHMLTDVCALGLSFLAAWFANHPATLERSYGYYRLEILAALINGFLLLGISVFIVIEALTRLNHPHPIHTGLMMWVAIGGLLINLFSAWRLHAQSEHNLNIRAAYLHVLSDSLGSVGAIVAALLMRQFGWLWADAGVSLLIASLIVWNAIRLLKETTHILLEGAPRHVDVAAIQVALEGLPDVVAVHDLHIWSINSTRHALSVHLQVRDASVFGPAPVEAAHLVLAEQFNIRHVTVQLELPKNCQTQCG